ncbi:division/cell wall cluster transcriptional repressor MraZ [Acidicapsa ligni]|uniref:division/cell wall cluster transcriptional repressor MraZ n=1 Tax=Acidicapsa ligni TaxID=542300 RepID=UPI0021DF8E6B|nr:division/cell wall cluster transcriptional repressor MraZ [Acidicapsa ligni]
MFRGTHEAKVDEKGRLKLPADFMKLIAEKNYGSQFFITSRDGKVAEIWPLLEWEKEEEKKAALPEDDEAKMTWMEVVNHFGQQVEIDKQDRLMLPRVLRDRFGLVNAEVVVTGLQRFLMLRSQQIADQRIEGILAPRSASEKPMPISEARQILASRESAQESRKTEF